MPHRLLFMLIVLFPMQARCAGLMEQTWVRDADAPVIGLGETGAFDDTHLFAPCVIQENGRFSLYYCGSRNDVANRVFQMGLATSDDGVRFTKHPAPVFSFGDGRHSILTPAVLRAVDGSVLREDGKLRLWFSATDFSGGSGVHTLHETRSEDGVHWSAPSPAQFEGVYAPTILKDGDQYRMWYTDVSAEPWVIRHASSSDGTVWERTEAPCIVIDQAWERSRLFYPAVIKHQGRFVMWYGAYWTARENTTAIGTAVSQDGLTWTKAPNNPVLMPDESRPWEAHYTTSQSVLKLPDGSWRMWYASRKAPPFENKYFAIGTARWASPAVDRLDAAGWPDRAAALRGKMADALTLPKSRVALEPATHRTTHGNGYRIESVTFASEPGSRVTALLYLPAVEGPVPAVLVACGHGGSKSALYAQYAGQLYAAHGFACLVIDTIGEEERHEARKMGARGHDLNALPREERVAFLKNELGRSVLGKIVWDLIRGVDYLASRPEIDASRMGVVGYSLGGASAGSLAILDPRIKSAIITGWGFIPSLAVYGKPCTQLPYRDFEAMMNFTEMTALLAPHAATLFLNGTADTIIDHDEEGAALRTGVETTVAGAKVLLEAAGIPHALEAEFVDGGCHRPYFLTPRAVQWMQEHLGHHTVQARPGTINYGEWVDRQGQAIEPLYATEARERGTTVVDVGAVYRDPAELACLPLDAPPPPVYTFAGWVEACLAQRESAAGTHAVVAGADGPSGAVSLDARLLAAVRAYANTMIYAGRDHYGEQHTPLFAAALDRRTLALPDGARLEAIRSIPREEWGVRNGDRALTGANPMHDQNLYQILYALSDIFGESSYAEAADAALHWFFTHARSEGTGLPAWGEHLSWDFRDEGPFLASGGATGTHEFFRPWELWPRTFKLAPEASAGVARALWEHQIGDHDSGAFSRHAGFTEHRSGTKDEYPRHGGFYIATWAHAYAATGDPAFLRYIEKLVGYFEGRRHPTSGALPAESADRSKGMMIWPSSNLSLAVDLHAGSVQVPESTAQRMRACAEKVDMIYLSLAHDPGENGRGFATVAHTETLACTGFTKLWATGYGQATDAQAADLCLLRYAQTQLPGYRDLAVAAAARYLDSAPDTTIPLYPGALADAIELMIQCYRLEGEEKYLTRAQFFAEEALRIFFRDSPLPRASAKHDHYEAITRGDTLAMELLKLWAVKHRPELVDRLIWNER